MSRSPRLEVPSSGFLESEIWEPRNLLGVGVVYCRWFVCAAVVCCGVHYAVRVSVRSNQQASESGETGEKGWLWGVGGGPAGVGIADRSEGRIDDKGECVGRGRLWEAEGRQRPLHAARQHPLPCWIVYARRCFVRRIQRVSAASLHSSRAPFWENYPVLTF